MIGADLAQRQAAGKERAAEKQPQFAYLEMLSPRVVRIALATTAILVGLFTVVGPIGTYVTFTPLQRLVYCGVLAGLGLPIYYCTMVVTLYYTRFQSRTACTLAVVAVIAIAAVSVTAMAYVLHVVVYPDSPIPDLAALYLSAAAAAISASLLFNYVIFQRMPAADSDGSSRLIRWRDAGHRCDQPGPRGVAYPANATSGFQWHADRPPADHAAGTLPQTAAR